VYGGLRFFRPNEFLMPTDINEALAKLSQHGKEAKVIAGGTGLYELIKRNYVPEVKYVVSIMSLGLSYIKQSNGEVRMGSTTHLQDVLESDVAANKGLEAISDALKEIRPPQIRNMATVGGEVCISVPNVDLPTALMACSAELVVVSLRGERKVPLEEFYTDVFLPGLKQGEIVKEVVLRPSRGSSAFLKFGRTAADFNLVNVAASVEVNDKLITASKVVVGGIDRSPLRFRELEEELTSKTPDAKSIQPFLEKRVGKLEILPTIHGSPEYKRVIMPPLITKCVTQAYTRALKAGRTVDDRAEIH
jgi:carbon-monoxide dehydrogenase medium subunit